MCELEIFDSDSKVVKLLKTKLNENSGVGFMPVLKGNPIKFEVSLDKTGVISSTLKYVVLKWEVFDAIVKKANSLGGKMYRGDSAAQKSCKLGDDKLSLNTIDGYIAFEFFNQKIGQTVTRRSTYFANILAWAGIVENHKSKGNGGFITINEEYRHII